MKSLANWMSVRWGPLPDKMDLSHLLQASADQIILENMG